jgi:hypothetical protein
MPDTSRQLLDPGRSFAGSALGATTPSSATTRQPLGTSPTTPGVLVATGARLIRQSGGTQKDINAWRKLDKPKRQAIKARVTARGGSLTKAVRKLGR